VRERSEEPLGLMRLALTIYAKDARKIVRNREDKELRETAYKLDRVQKKIDSIAKKAAWAFYSVI
jgi:hypothetical protein